LVWACGSDACCGIELEGGCGFMGRLFPVARAFCEIVGFWTETVRVIRIEAVAGDEAYESGEGEAVVCGYGTQNCQRGG
jgi:hypothetical protein